MHHDHNTHNIIICLHWYFKTTLWFVLMKSWAVTENVCARGGGGGRGRKLCDSLIWPADGDKSGDKGDLWTLNPITLLSCSVNTITAYFFLFLLKQTEQTGREDKWMCSNPDTAYVVFSHLPLPPFPPLLLFHCCLYLEPSVPFREDENHQQHIYTCLRLQ